jgi:hypothetical protein
MPKSTLNPILGYGEADWGMGRGGMSYNFFKDNLREQGYLLAEEIHEGKWDNAAGIERPAAAPEIIAELRRRCPGFTDTDYGRAIADGLSNSR